jgi:hypothetical protein
MSVALENLIVTKLVRYLNDEAGDILPCPVYNNEHPDAGEALWIQPNGGERKTQEYVGGSFRGEFPFTLCYQLTNPANITGRLAALDLPFYQLSEWLEEKTDPIQLDPETLIDFEMVTHPATSFISDDKQTVVHEAVFRITYRRRRQ